MSRFARPFASPAAGSQALDGFVDALLQTFENSRPGLTSEMLARADIEPFFAELYVKETRGLREKIAHLTHLSEDERRELFERVDERIRKVVLPGYARLAAGFTPRERNDFYLASEPLHGVERAAWGVLGLALGGLVIWAPFIPLWSKEWVLVFGLGGLVFPSLRRFFAWRRYESQLNDLVRRTDDEIWRLDLGYLSSAWERGAASPTPGAGASPSRPRTADDAALEPESGGPARAARRPQEGER
jgi:hypothetical protein